MSEAVQVRRLVCSGIGEVEWSRTTLRAVGENDVLVRHRFGVEKHGTMMAFFKGYANQRGRWDAAALLHRPGEGVLWNYPIPLGNQQVGVIEAVGSAVPDLSVGDTVYFHGFFQEATVLASDSVRLLPESAVWQDAMLMDPAEFALGAIRDSGLRLGDAVAVFGLGAIGLTTVQLALAAGASQVIAVDPIAKRREIAEMTGADVALDPVGADVGLQLRELTQGRGPDVIIDFSGSRHALQAALRGVAYGGTIACGAFPPPFDAGLDLGGEAHMNRPRIIFTRACSDPNPDHPRWSHARIQSEVAQFIAIGALQGEKLIDPIVPFDDLINVYPRIATDPESMIKLGVTYP